MTKKTNTDEGVKKVLSQLRLLFPNGLNTLREFPDDKDLMTQFKVQEEVEQFIRKALSTQKQELLKRVEEYLLDHYWDTLDEDIVKLHIKAVFEKLKQISEN